MYVDDFISRRINTTAVKRLKQLIINIFGEAQFILHKWQPSVPELKDDNNSEEIRTYATARLGVNVMKQKSRDLRGTELPILLMLLFQN